MIKTVIVLNGEIINIGKWESNEPMPEGATIEERDMEFTDENGWREIGYAPHKTELELLKERLTTTENALVELILGGM